MEEIIEKIKKLVSKKGYIYALSMILFEDFHVPIEELHEVNDEARISVKEASLLLGFLIQNKIDFEHPNADDLISMKQDTYTLMKELHNTFMGTFVKNLEEEFLKNKSQTSQNNLKNERDFFKKGEMFIEPIFYSGTGLYDFQYLNFLNKKYKNDEQWLIDNKKFDITKAEKIVFRIKEFLQEKSKKVHLKDLKEELPKLKEQYAEKDFEEMKKALPLLELHQYVDLFFDFGGENIEQEYNEKTGWKLFYKNIIDLFVIDISDFDNDLDVVDFLNNFSIEPSNNCNKQFNSIGNYNLINSHPIIKLSDTKYFVPITFLVFEAVYESPFYWMITDPIYKDFADKNRGDFGENLVYSFLLNTFKTGVYKSIRIQTQKGIDDTDIDVLFVLGNKALCIQIKSKKLTELSRSGDDLTLKSDFSKAIQEAYRQGLLSRKKILDKKSKFFDKNSNEIFLPKEVNEVYLMCIITENYPSLTHQVHTMLEKDENDPFPLVLTIFDLELILHYLSDPFDFLYYIKQRTSLLDYFISDEEMIFLGYHLMRKLFKIPNIDRMLIDKDYGKIIDRNYYPIIAGISVSDDGDAIKTRWKNDEFDKLCKTIKGMNDKRVTDIVFMLLDWSGDGRDSLVSKIKETKNKTLIDGKTHDICFLPDIDKNNQIGITYVSLKSNNLEELRDTLVVLCEKRKYLTKSKYWLGLGNIFDGEDFINTIIYNDDDWVFDKELENVIKNMGNGQFVRIGKKVGRNELCPCGSRLKYKKCCGK